MIPARPFPAMLLKVGSERFLVASDLHLGWEVAFAEQGVHVPSQMPKLLKKLYQLLDLYKPNRLIFLGDVKHTIANVEMEEWRDIPDFFEALSKKVSKIQIVLGNHDGNLEPLLPASVELLPPTGVALGNVGLFHGHTWPETKLLGCRTLVIGHLHPSVAFYDPMGYRITSQVWVTAKCNSTLLAKYVLRHAKVKVKRSSDPAILLEKHFNVKLKASRLVILPSFNDFLGGSPVNKRGIDEDKKFREFIGPVLRSGIVDIDRAEVYLLDGTFLGNIHQLRNLGLLQHDRA